jgi:hypothetical protein
MSDPGGGYGLLNEARARRRSTDEANVESRPDEISLSAKNPGTPGLLAESIDLTRVGSDRRLTAGGLWSIDRRQNLADVQVVTERGARLDLRGVAFQIQQEQLPVPPLLGALH